MKKFLKFSILFPVLFLVINQEKVNGQTYLLASDKKIYSLKDSIIFGYIYVDPNKPWVALWLNVVPNGNSGGSLTAAADLGTPGRGEQTYPASRFGAGKFKAMLVGTDRSQRWEYVVYEFEIQSELKEFIINNLEVEDKEIVSRTAALRAKIRGLKMELQKAIQKRDSAFEALQPITILLEATSAEMKKTKALIEKLIGRAREAEWQQARLSALRKEINETPSPDPKIAQKKRDERDSLQKLLFDNTSMNTSRLSSIKLYTAKFNALNRSHDSILKINTPLYINPFENAEDRVRNLQNELGIAETDLYEQKENSVIESIHVFAGSRKVFQAEFRYSANAAQLKDLIRKAKSDRDEFEKVKDESLVLFQDANRAALAAGKKLAGNAGWTGGGEIMKAAYWNAAGEFIFFTKDVGQAWVETGPLGALLTAAKKSFEVNYFDNVSDMNEPTPGSIAAQINEEFEAEIHNPLSLKYAAQTGYKLIAENAAKEFIFERGKHNIQGNLLVHISQIIKRQQFINKNLTEFRKYIKYTRNMHNGQPFKVSISNLANGLAWDLLQQAVFKDWASQGEVNAWHDYFKKQIIAKSLFPFYTVAVKNFWSADSLYQILLGMQKKLNEDEGININNPYKITLSEKFREKDDLVITVQLKPSTNSKYKLRVTLNSTEAAFRARNKFSFLVPANLSTDEKGQVLLNLNLFDTPMNSWNKHSYE